MHSSAAPAFVTARPSRIRSPTGSPSTNPANPCSPAIPRKTNGKPTTSGWRFVRARGIYPLRVSRKHHASAAICEAFYARCKASPGPKFPILLKKVLYDGTHTGDWIPIKESPALLKEVDTVLHSSDILAESEKEFFNNMKQLCEASIATGNPIMF